MNNEEKILQILEQMQSDMTEVKTDIKYIKTDIKYIKIGQDEHGKILGALIHNSEVHKAEIDKVNIETAKISGAVETVETKIDTLSNDLNTIEQVTGKNLTDIAKLKAIK